MRYHRRPAGREHWNVTTYRSLPTKQQHQHSSLLLTTDTQFYLEDQQKCFVTLTSLYFASTLHANCYHRVQREVSNMGEDRKHPLNVPILLCPNKI